MMVVYVILQESSKILIHSKVFFEELLKIKINHRKSLTYLFNNYIKENANYFSNKIEILYLILLKNIIKLIIDLMGI
jgi:hypothetical protein